MTLRTSSTTTRRALVALVAGVVALVLGGAVACGTDPTRSAGSAPEGTTTTLAPTTTTTSTVPPTTAPTTVPPLVPGGGPTAATGPGDDGDQVLALQQRLYDLGYFLPAVDGTYDSDTSHAVMAFQKRTGLARDGVAGPDTVAALAAATRVEPTQGMGPHLEVSLEQQVLVVVDGKGGAVAVDATTGKASTPTPAGRFAVFRQVNAWDPGPNGALYRPKYFVGGVAVHGGPPVIAGPASHGCVRVPDPAIDWLWSAGLAPIGTTVVVT